MVDGVLTVEQAAERLGVSARTLQLWIGQRKLPGAYRLDLTNGRSPYQVPVRDIVCPNETR